MPFERDLEGGLVTDVESHERCRDVGDFAMKTVERVAFGPIGICGFDAIGRAVVLKPAPCQEFVETFKPTESAPVHEVHEGWIDRAVLGWRIPADAISLIVPLPDPHASRWNHREGKNSRIHLDEIDP